MKSIENKIACMPKGFAFTSIDFSEFPYETVKKALTRLEKSGIIRRVMRGVYDVPEYSETSHLLAPPDMSSVAEALARKYQWIIAPTGNTALNALGLSTQVPANWVYISTGPYKTYNVAGRTLEFRHRATNQLTGMSPKSALVVQGIKAIGRNEMDAETREAIRHQLSPRERTALKEEARYTTPWVYSEIKELCSEEG